MSYKVLIVEDDPMVAMINEQYVNKNPDFITAGSCRNGKEALDFLEKNKVDLVVLDVYMPYMDGIETLKQIRQKNISTQVIMVTAANDTTTIEQTMNLGVLDYLIKPFALERFQIALEKFVAKTNALNKAETLDQNSIDSLISGRNEVKTALPKGIQEKTLETIKDYFQKNPDWQSGDTVANNLGLSIVTIRHYLSFLVENGSLQESINYETGGRPSMLYKLCTH